MPSYVQVRVPELIAQPESDPAASIVQLRPVPVGRASVTWTFVAVALPLLVTVTMNPIGLPAATEAESAILVMTRSLAQLTMTEAVALLSAALVSPVAVTVAVFVIAGQSRAVAVRLTVTVLLVPEAIVPKVHPSVPEAIAHSAAFAPPSVQVPAGSVSLTATSLDGPVPPALTMIVNVAVPPALTAALPDLAIETFGWQVTAIDAVALLFSKLLSPVALTVAVLAIPLAQSPSTADRLTVMDRELPGVIAPKSHERALLMSVQFAASAPASAHVPAGSVSLRVTLLELPVPPAVTMIVKVATLPVTTGPFPDFATVTSGWQFTVIDAVAGPALSAPAETLALLPTVPQVAVVVGDVTCTVKLDADARLAFVQVRTPAAMPHVGVPVVPAIVQLRPAFVGKVSVIDTLLALPAPVLLTVTVNPIGEPAVTDAASAVLVIASDGERTALDMIWLSRFPIDAPSARSHLMWYGPPLTLPEPSPIPHPRGPVDGAR